MSTPPISVTCEAAGTVTPFVHNLGGPVDVIGYDATDERVGVIVNPITDDEVEVIDPSGLAIRLVATPAVPEDPSE